MMYRYDVLLRLRTKLLLVRLPAEAAVDRRLGGSNGGRGLLGDSYVAPAHGYRNRSPISMLQRLKDEPYHWTSGTTRSGGGSSARCNRLSVAPMVRSHACTAKKWGFPFHC